MKKLIPKSHFDAGRRLLADSLKERERHLEGNNKKQNIDLLARAEQAWTDLTYMREEYLRNLRYVRGDQWADFVEDENGNLVRERDRITKRTGGVALQNNHLIKIVNALTGLFSKTAAMPVCYARKEDADQKSQMMTRTLKTNWDNNDMKDLLDDQFFQLIVGGVAAVKELWSEHEGIDDAYTYKVDLGHLFWEMEGTDPRHWDVALIGEFRDYTLGELASTYAGSDYDYNQLSEIYRPFLNPMTRTQPRSDYHEEGWNAAGTNGLCRVYEIWTKEHKPGIRCKDIMDTEQPLYHIDPKDLWVIKKENTERLAQAAAMGMPPEEVPLIEYEGPGLGYKIYEYWHFWALTPDGRILVDYDSPYEHGSHPYTVKMYLYANGHTTPFISCVRDQQRYINRLITLNDMLINNSIKSLKLIPKDLVPEHMSYREFARQAVDMDGWIFYEPKNRATNTVPQIISQNSTNIGIHELLQVELNSINDITNVSGALQGKTPSSGTSAQRYMLETQNSTTSVAALLSKFNTFTNGLARKKLKTIHQYYQTPRPINVEQNNGYNTFEMYEPLSVRDIDFDVKIGEAVELPVARMLTNSQLEQWAANGWIGLQDLLTYGYYPNLEELKQKVASTEEIAGATQGTQGAADPQSNTNPETVNLMQNILRGNGKA